MGFRFINIWYSDFLGPSYGLFLVLVWEYFRRTLLKVELLILPWKRNKDSNSVQITILLKFIRGVRRGGVRRDGMRRGGMRREGMRREGMRQGGEKAKKPRRQKGEETWSVEAGRRGDAKRRGKEARRREDEEAGRHEVRKLEAERRKSGAGRGGGGL